MENNSLKDLWKKDNREQTPQINLESQNEVHLPLEKIRKNMRMEFWSTAVVFLLIIVFFILKDMYVLKFKVYIISLVVSQMLITSFYFLKFFNLYKNLSNLNLNASESLKDLMHQFKLNEQYYLSFYISFVPFIVCEILLIFEFIPKMKELDGLPFVLWFTGTCLVSLITLFAIGKWWFQKFYGKYIGQIQQLMADLN